MNYMSKEKTDQEFGLFKNRNSQAFIESFHAMCKVEFQSYSDPESIEEFFQEYTAYLNYYHYLRFHGSLRSPFSDKLLTPFQFQQEIDVFPSDLPIIDVFI